ncbi:hypothetical protein PILCRDRAFT_97962 [Piloderma croceum F 1598]|uniref:Aminotransferase class I/classII large domain-containing protein n=1 Tax=Piloderma croceum (strain F 1598) TaxID=765440 RepID=A0A0C3B2E9_PILCF|nr:hypothetical protein PILCRDRAFT_97962 [Piloderma croceum F 1598]
MAFTTRDPNDPSKEIPLSLTDSELATGLQYGATAGFDGLVAWVYGLQELAHGRKGGEGWIPSIGAGSQDLIYKAVNAILDHGDVVLVESPVYAGVIPMFRSLHCEQIEVETDANGISSQSLRSILESWPVGKPKPKCLYTVPYGCNPTGMTAILERRKEVLQLAREYNFLILEDDPYYYLYYGKATRPPSYFTLELDEPEVGRVLRFDSLSKILSAGIRIGFTSGPEPLVQAMNRHTATANLQASSIAQAITLKLLTSWGYEGFFKHTHAVSQFYKGKRDVFERMLHKHLEGLAEWTSPEAGMFVWFKLLLKAPNSTNDGDDDGDSESIIRKNALQKGVLALPGTVFLPNGRKTAYVRASFSLLSETDVDEAVRRLKEVILEARRDL